MDFEQRLKGIMFRSGCTVGQAIERLKNEDPQGCATWQKTFKLTPEGWLKWAKDIAADAEAMRKDAGAAADIPFDFMRIVRGVYVAHDGLSLPQALGKAARYFPELHTAYLEKHNAGRKLRTPAAEGHMSTEGTPGKFESMVAGLVAGGMSTSTAISTVAARHPAVHQEFISRRNREYREQKQRGA